MRYMLNKSYRLLKIVQWYNALCVCWENKWKDEKKGVNTFDLMQTLLLFLTSVASEDLFNQ